MLFYMQQEVMAEDEVKLVNVSWFLLCYLESSNDPLNNKFVGLPLCLSAWLFSVIDYSALNIDRVEIPFSVGCKNLAR